MPGSTNNAEINWRNIKINHEMRHHICQTLTLLSLCLFTLFISSCRTSRNTGKQPFILVIDAGHGGRDLGASGRQSHEKDLTLQTAKRFHKLVRKKCKNVEVILTRIGDEYVSLDDRAGMANFFNADLFMSIHANSARGWAEGTETFIHPSARGSRSEHLATLIQEQYANEAGRRNRGVKTANFAVLRKTKMPSILTEIGFISNKEEEKYIKSKKGQKELAKCLYNAFSQYYKDTYR